MSTPSPKSYNKYPINLDHNHKQKRLISVVTDADNIWQKCSHCEEWSEIIDCTNYPAARELLCLLCGEKKFKDQEFIIKIRDKSEKDYIRLMNKY